MLINIYEQDNWAAWSVALNFKLWSSAHPANVSFACEELSGQTSNNS